VTWRDIESLAPKGGRFPRAWEIRLTGRAAEIASELGVKRLHLAASRSRTHAMAMVVLEASDR
jgi:phosphopantetheinyl transferase (holo-ACP synthase)